MNMIADNETILEAGAIGYNWIWIKHQLQNEIENIIHETHLF